MKITGSEDTREPLTSVKNLLQIVKSKPNPQLIQQR